MNPAMTARPTPQAPLRSFGVGLVCAARLRWAIAALALGCGCVSTAWGQALSDPTRPPQAWLAAQPKGAGALSGMESETVMPQLQSLLIGPTRSYALIEGQLLGVGDTFRDARVVAVRPTEVVLRSEHGTQTLKLFPDVEKRPVKPVAADAGRAPGKAKRVVRVIGIGTNVTKENK
jgi:hypothetical protein